MAHPSPVRASARHPRGAPSLELADLTDASRLIAKLHALFAAPGYRPPALPAVALQVHTLSRRPDATTARVVAVLERDPMLAAEVIRRASSAQQGGRSAPRTLRDAAVRLGVNGLSNFVMEVALMGRVFRAPGLDAPMQQLQRHSTVVAACARAVAEQARLPDPDSVELAGLLHDVGLVAGLHLVGSVARGKPVDLATVATPLRDCHVEAGARIIRIWGLPSEIADAVDHHHAPLVTTQVAGAQVGRLDTVAACIVLADVIATDLGAGLHFGDRQLERQSEAAITQSLEGLGLGPIDLDAIRMAVSDRVAH